jgi:SPOR domain
MSISGSRSAGINLDEFERRLRAAGTQPAGAEDPLSELARLVEGSWPPPSEAPAISRTEVESAPRLDAGVLRPQFEGLRDEDLQESDDERLGSLEAKETPAPDYVRELNPPAPVPDRRPANWTLRVAALAVVGIGMIGAVLALKGGVPGLPKPPPFIAAAQGPTKVQPPSEETVAATNDAGTNLLKDSTQAGHVKVVASEEQPVDLNAQGSASAAPANPSASNTSPVTGVTDAPVVVATTVAPPPVAQQFPDPKPVRTVSLRPDGTPIPASTLAASDAGGAAPVSEAPKPPAKTPAKPAPDAAVGTAQPSTPKLELPTKLSGKSSARVVVAKTDTTAPGAAGDAANQPVPPGAPAKTEKLAKAAKTQQAAAEAASPPTAAAAVDATAATTSGGWAVQLAAPKSEAEAKSTAARLSAKYGSALNGSPIGVHKAVVNGETIYRLRVGGLTKADAAALCARLKGDGGDCFIAK